jgi:hypothetical protein
MPTSKTKKLEAGQTVYARWHGDSTFVVIREATGNQLPHYICRLKSLYAVEENWMFPLIHLSSQPITRLTESSNRPQLSLFKKEKNGDLFD